MDTFNKQDSKLKMPIDSFANIIPLYNEIANRYYKCWNLCCKLCDHNGRIVLDKDGTECSCKTLSSSVERKKAIDEALRWGEPSLLLSSKGSLIWAIPIMENSLVIGGFVVESNSDGSDAAVQTMSTSDIRKAVNDLLTLAEEYNLTNSALLELRRLDAARESDKAVAIHEVKDQNYQSIRDIYLREELPLISAIKRGDKSKAREIINRVLVGIYYLGRERPPLLKSFILELVVTMSRSAVEAGGDPNELLGTNYSRFAELAGMETEEEICAWLVSMLERMMDAIKSNKQYPNSVLINAAVNFMQEHLKEEITRDLAADVACLSPSHFSRVVKQTFGYSFTDMLAKMRVEKAKEYLSNTDKSLIRVSMDCGFNDQSYFTKVFQKYTNQTPGEYRKSHKEQLSNIKMISEENNENCTI